jgi:DNA-binding CsgD family transcriptional regulator
MSVVVAVPEHSHVASAAPEHPHRGQAFAAHDGYPEHTHDGEGHPRTPWYVRHPPLDGRLTRRERDVMALVADGLTNKEIAAVLHVRPDTVRTHRQNALRRLRVRTTAAAVAILLRRGDIL